MRNFDSKLRKLRQVNGTKDLKCLVRNIKSRQLNNDPVFFLGKCVIFMEPVCCHQVRQLQSVQ